jgi:hypothetical protein
METTSIYCLRKDTNIENVPEPIDWFTKSDIQKVIDSVSNSNNYLIMDINCYNVLQTNCSDQLNQVLSRYTFIEQTDKFYLWKPVK